MTVFWAGPGLLVGVVRGKGGGIVGGSRNRPINSSNDPILVFGTLQEMCLIRPATSKRAKELALSLNQVRLIHRFHELITDGRQ